MPDALPSVGRVALADHVYDALYQNLLDLTVPPEGRLNIDQVARELEVSPTPVREALARLEADEIVIKRPLAGYQTAPLLPRAALADLIALRLQIEPWLAGQAAERVRAQPTSRLEPHPVAGGADPSAAAIADAAQHDAIAALAGNALARQALRRLNSHFHIYRHYASHGRALPVPAAEHQRVVDAVAAGRRPAAEQAMRAHLDATRERLTAI
jgi:DNA-binding GntR family transcriptional regulator